MKTENNIISYWLEKNINSDIDKKVEKELKIINTKTMLKIKIKEYCKIHKIKFIKFHNNGFLASSKVDIKAGMKKILGIDKYEHIDIKVIGQKEIIRHYLCYSDLDIVDNGIFTL
jgi:hypothetical protein